MKRILTISREALQTSSAAVWLYLFIQHPQANRQSISVSRSRASEIVHGKARKVKCFCTKNIPRPGAAPQGLLVHQATHDKRMFEKL
jgi:hypothetical protein